MNPKKYRIDPNDGDRQKNCAWLATYNKMFMPAWGDVVNFKFCFLNFVQQRGTVIRFENPSRHKHKRWRQPEKRSMIKWLKDLWEKSGDGKLFFGTYILPLAGLFFTWGFFGHLYMSNLHKNDLKEINGAIEWIGIVTETSSSRSGAKYHPLKIELQGQSDTYVLHDNFKHDFKRIEDNLRVGDNVRLYRRTKFQSIISWGKTNDIFVIEKDNTIIFGLEKMIAFKKEQMDTFAGFSMVCWTLYILYIYDKKREKVKNLGSRQQNI